MRQRLQQSVRLPHHEVEVILFVIFMVALSVAREQLSQEPQAFLLLLRVLSIVFLLRLPVFARLFRQRQVVVLVRIMHKVDQVRVIILDRIPVEQYVLLAKRSIFLLFLYQLLMPFTCRVVVWDLGLKLYHGG